MTSNLNSLAEARRAAASPLFANLDGDIGVSFEFFPPKTDKMEAQLWDTFRTLEPLAPRFVSVTYGAGGSTRERTHATVARIAAESEVEAAMLAMMHNRRLGHLLDIGTGTGRMAEIFAPTARRITALDRSPEMLRIARAKLAGQVVPVDLVQGDFLNLPVGDASVDSIVIHQALHFAHEPDRVIAEASRVLRGGGHLLIVDFAPHEDEELRTVGAHARLGFSDAQIRGWFASTGLLLETTQTLEGGDLAVKLWLGRRRSDEDQPPVAEGGQTKRLAA